jgi:excisionase family DNA binding protein
MNSTIVNGEPGIGTRLLGQMASQMALLSVQEVAGILGVSERHVYRLSDAGKMPPKLKLGKSVRWSEHAIDSWISAGCPAMRTMKGRQH